MLMAMRVYEPIVVLSETFHFPHWFLVASCGSRSALMCMPMCDFPIEKIEEGLIQTLFNAPFVHKLMPYCLIVYVAD